MLSQQFSGIFGSKFVTPQANGFKPVEFWQFSVYFTYTQISVAGAISVG
jgi:hypothetical protein